MLTTKAVQDKILERQRRNSIYIEETDYGYKIALGQYIGIGDFDIFDVVIIDLLEYKLHFAYFKPMNGKPKKIYTKRKLDKTFLEEFQLLFL
jgi:hypothetical protein